MRRALYSIWDAASESFSDPFACPTDAVAVRQFKQYLLSIPYKLRADFDLLYICEFDAVNGTVIDCFENKVIMKGEECIDDV